MKSKFLRVFDKCGGGIYLINKEHIFLFELDLTEKYDETHLTEEPWDIKIFLSNEDFKSKQHVMYYDGGCGSQEGREAFDRFEKMLCENPMKEEDEDDYYDPEEEEASSEDWPLDDIMEKKVQDFVDECVQENICCLVVERLLEAKKDQLSFLRDIRIENNIIKDKEEFEALRKKESKLKDSKLPF